MDWIHCNVCFVQPSREKAFSLTSCGHMYCSDCLGIGTNNGECKICQSKCTYIQLVQDMEPNVKEFFTQPEDIVASLTQVLAFQKKHRLKLTGHWMSLNKKFEAARSEISRLQDLSKKLYNNMKELHKQNTALKMQLANCNSHQVPSTPYKIPATPRLFSSAKSSHAVVPNIQSSQSYSSKFVTPNKVNKQRNTSGMPYSVNRSYSITRSVDMLKPPHNVHHSFLTPPNDTPPTVFKYARS